MGPDLYQESMVDLMTNTYSTIGMPPSSENWTRWKMSKNKDDVLFFENIDDEYWYQFQEDYRWFFYLVVLMYWVSAYKLQSYMKNREPVENISNYMVVYNVLVAAFSMFALWRISTTFFPIFFSGPNKVYRTLCLRFEVTSKDGFWLLACGWSKLVHFLDTFFTVLRKKPVQFIQMYHHSVVLLVPLHILQYGEPILFWWGLTNLAQHSLTYPYFALKSMKLNVPKIFSNVIVMVEVLQMFIGLFSGIYTLQVINSGGYCVRHPKSISIMYFVYGTMTVCALHMAYNHFSTAVKNAKKSA